MNKTWRVNWITVFCFMGFLVMSIVASIFAGRAGHWHDEYNGLDTKHGIELLANVWLTRELEGVLGEKNDLSEENERLRRDVKMLAALDPTDFLLSDMDTLTLLDYIPKGNPFNDSWRLTSRFGSDKGFGGDPRRGHQGQDMVCDADYRIKPIEEGVVVDIGIGKYEGKWILIEHNDYVRTKVMHLETIYYTALPGEIVTTDTIIGYMGSTGYSDGAHLHIEIQIFNGSAWQPIDPYPFIEGEIE